MKITDVPKDHPLHFEDDVVIKQKKPVPKPGEVKYPRPRHGAGIIAGIPFRLGARKTERIDRLEENMKKVEKHIGAATKRLKRTIDK